MVPETNAELVDAIARLRKFDTPTVLNVIELFDVRPHHRGYSNGSIRALFPDLPPMVGFAFTARYTAASPGPGYVLGDQIEAILHTPAPRVVVLQSSEDPPSAAIFGDISCSVYRKFGCVGLVTDGAGRDLAQIRKLDFPCFAREVISSHGYARFTAFDVPVTVGGLQIIPGQLLHGDASGVAMIPVDMAVRVASLCGAMLEAEAELLRIVHDPAAGIAEVRDAHRGFLAQIEDLKRQIRR